jgi:hypothetical protein
MLYEFDDFITDFIHGKIKMVLFMLGIVEPLYVQNKNTMNELMRKRRFDTLKSLAKIVRQSIVRNMFWMPNVSSNTKWLCANLTNGCGYNRYFDEDRDINRYCYFISPNIIADIYSHVANDKLRKMINRYSTLSFGRRATDEVMGIVNDAIDRAPLMRTELDFSLGMDCPYHIYHTVCFDGSADFKLFWDAFRAWYNERFCMMCSVPVFKLARVFKFSGIKEGLRVISDHSDMISKKRTASEKPDDEKPNEQTSNDNSTNDVKTPNDDTTNEKPTENASTNDDATSNDATSNEQK